MLHAIILNHGGLTRSRHSGSAPFRSRSVQQQHQLFFQLAGPGYVLLPSQRLLKLTVAGFSVREAAPQTLPDKPPFTAHLGNLAYDVTNDAVADFLTGCGVVNVRLIEDRELQRPKGFGYVEFETLDGLKQALALDGESFGGRMIKIKVADPRELAHIFHIIDFQPNNA